MIRFHGLPSQLEELEIIDWLNGCAASYNRSIQKLSVSIVDTKRIREINQAFLQHDYPTDIISFDYAEGESIVGELYIGLPVIKANAREYGVAAGDELCRVIAHGLLHLIGYDDQNEEERRLMWQNEDKCLLLRPKNLTNKEL